MAEFAVYVVSGGSGTTATQVLRACLAQFPEQHVRLVPEFSITGCAEAEAVAEKAARSNAVICHTLVDPSVRQALTQASLVAGVACIDLLGPMLAVLGERLAQQPAGRAGLLYELHKEQFDRMDAVDFTMSHDDGRRLEDLAAADVVLVGVSRVSKSVTCFYLASRGIRAANVPLVAGTLVPEELLQLDPSKVIGLTMNASHLASIRQKRLERIAAKHEVPRYADMRELRRELREVEELISRQRWTRIDVSYKATEEVASEILEALRRRGVLAHSAN